MKTKLDKHFDNLDRIAEVPINAIVDPQLVCFNDDVKALRSFMEQRIGNCGLAEDDYVVNPKSVHPPQFPKDFT